MITLLIGAQEMLLLFIAIPVFIAYLFGMIHCIANDNMPGANRVLWCLMILALPLIGTLAYWFLGRKQVRTTS